MIGNNAFKGCHPVEWGSKYQVVSCPKYRRKVLVEGPAVRLKENIAGQVHILCEVDPQLGVHKFTKRF